MIGGNLLQTSQRSFDLNGHVQCNSEIDGTILAVLLEVVFFVGVKSTLLWGKMKFYV